jgi:hypothetical protein
MGADFTAIIGFNRSEHPIELLYEDLKIFRNFQFTKQWIEDLMERYPNSNWGNSWYVSNEDSYIEIGGMGGMVLLLTDKCCMVSHYIRWHHFIMDNSEIDVQKNLRLLIKEVASNIGANQALYIPDSTYTTSKAQDLFYDGKEYSQIAKWLLYECGEPAVRISDLFDSSSNEISTNGYYIDCFELNIN